MTTDRIVMIFAGSAVFIRSYLKIRIFVRDQGEAENQPAGILKYVEDLRRGFNADIGRKNFFEIASIKSGVLTGYSQRLWPDLVAVIGGIPVQNRRRPDAFRLECLKNPQGDIRYKVLFVLRVKNVCFES